MGSLLILVLASNSFADEIDDRTNDHLKSTHHSIQYQKMLSESLSETELPKIKDGGNRNENQQADPASFGVVDSYAPTFDDRELSSYSGSNQKNIHDEIQRQIQSTLESRELSEEYKIEFLKQIKQRAAAAGYKIQIDGTTIKSIELAQ
jgi:hypothetical protein